MVTTLIFISAFLTTNLAMAQNAIENVPSSIEPDPSRSKPPKLLEWYKEWKKANELFASNMNAKIVIIKMTDKTFESLRTESLASRENAHFFAPANVEIDLTMGVNGTLDRNPCRQRRPQILRCFSAGYILDVTKPNWELLSAGKSPDKLIRMLKAPMDPEGDYFKWLKANLGYDARVLEAKNGFVLALAPKIQNSANITGHILNDSADKSFLQTSAKKPGPKLQLIEAHGRLALFKILTESQKDEVKIPLSTKIIFDEFETPNARENTKANETNSNENDE